MKKKSSARYYNAIALGYDELYMEEQSKKVNIVKKLIKVEKNYKLLDVGCGTGVSSQFGCEVVGIDPSEKMLDFARKRGIKCIKCFAEEMPFEDSSFDVVVSISAAQNFWDIKRSLEEIKRVGKEDFIITIIRRSKKNKEIKDSIKEIFKDFIIKKEEEEKDFIYFIKKVENL